MLTLVVPTEGKAGSWELCVALKHLVCSVGINKPCACVFVCACVCMFYFFDDGCCKMMPSDNTDQTVTLEWVGQHSPRSELVITCYTDANTFIRKYFMTSVTQLIYNRCV